MNWLNKMRARRHVRASLYRTALEDLPDGLETAWRLGAPQEYPGIRTDAFFFACAAEGLMRFFDAIGHSERPCALPSDAADSVWHAWLRREPIGLERFCRRHFGRTIPHVERGGLATDALANTLVTGRRLEGITRLGPELPRLFGLDARLRMPNGHGYWRRDGEIVYARLDKRGLCFRRAQPHPGLTIAALLAAGLVDADMVLGHMRLQQASSLAGSSCGSFADGSLGIGFAGDGGCSDSGGSDGGGSSCGSSCGGGCGGGGD